VTRAVVAVVVVVASVSAAAPAAAFKCTRAGDTGPSLFWKERAVTLQRSGVGHEVGASDIERVIQASAAAWTNIDCSDVTESLGGSTDDRVVGFDWSTGVGSPTNHNIVVFRNDNANDPLDQWQHDLGAIAITTVTFETNEGRLLDADVEVNDAGFDFTATDQCNGSQMDLQNTLTHEFGHVLGLDHTTVADATMFPSAPACDTSKRTLADDDIQAICTIYPAGQPIGNCFPDAPRAAPPSVRFEPTLCGAAGSASSLAVFALVLLVRNATRHRRIR
jgi:hypothetical protein